MLFSPLKLLLPVSTLTFLLGAALPAQETPSNADILKEYLSVTPTQLLGDPICGAQSNCVTIRNLSSKEITYIRFSVLAKRSDGSSQIYNLDIDSVPAEVSWKTAASLPRIGLNRNLQPGQQAVVQLGAGDGATDFGYHQEIIIECLIFGDNTYFGDKQIAAKVFKWRRQFADDLASLLKLVDPQWPAGTRKTHLAALLATRDNPEQLDSPTRVLRSGFVTHLLGNFVAASATEEGWTGSLTYLDELRQALNKYSTSAEVAQ